MPQTHFVNIKWTDHVYEIKTIVNATQLLVVHSHTDNEANYTIGAIFPSLNSTSTLIVYEPLCGNSVQFFPLSGFNT